MAKKPGNKFPARSSRSLRPRESNLDESYDYFDKELEAESQDEADDKADDETPDAPEEDFFSEDDYDYFNNPDGEDIVFEHENDAYAISVPPDPAPNDEELDSPVKKRRGRPPGKKKSDKQAGRQASKKPASELLGEEQIIQDGLAGRLVHVEKDQVFSYRVYEKPRKLSKKAKADIERWNTEQRYTLRDTFMASLVESAKRKFGSNMVLAGDEASKLMIVLPMPSLALEWLFGQSGFPLSTVVQLVGKWGTCKSAFLYDIFRWFSLCGGGAIHQENETKFSDVLCSSIMGEKNYRGSVIVNRTTSVEDWQERITYYMKEQKRRMIGTAEEPGPGRTVPICFGLDSVTGKSSRETQEKVSREGAAGRGHPIEALLITRYFQSTMHEYADWPFSAVLVNHLKQAMGQDQGGPESRTAGGSHISFQEGFEIEMSIWRSRINTAKFRGIGIRLTSTKNSFAEGRHSIQSRLLWNHTVDPETGLPKQLTRWDWDWATIKFLDTLEKPQRDRLKDIAGFTLHTQSPMADVECMAQCSALGMGKKDWESFSKVGAMLRKSPKLLKQVRAALGILEVQRMEGDYIQNLNNAAEGLL